MHGNMNSFKSILQKFYKAFPYIYFSFLALWIFSDHLNSTGTFWSESLLILISSVFIIQLKYKLKYVDVVLGIFTLLWSCWMLLAVYSDAIKIEDWSWTMKQYMIVVFVVMNFVCSFLLLIKERHESGFKVIQ